MSDDDVSTLSATRSYAADRETLWRAWTSDLGAWIWPERFTTQVELEPQVGSTYRVWSREMGMGVGGVVQAADPPRLLELTWRWEGEDAETRVTVGLEHDARGTTTLRLEHGGHTSAQQRADHVEGWGHCLQRLDAWVSRSTAPASTG